MKLRKYKKEDSAVICIYDYIRCNDFIADLDPETIEKFNRKIDVYSEVL